MSTDRRILYEDVNALTFNYAQHRHPVSISYSNSMNSPMNQLVVLNSPTRNITDLTLQDVNHLSMDQQVNNQSMEQAQSSTKSKTKQQKSQAKTKGKKGKAVNSQAATQ